MFSTRRSVICVALLASASGCSEGLGPLGAHEPEPVLYPVLSERGHLTYSMNDHARPPRSREGNPGRAVCKKASPEQGQSSGPRRRQSCRSSL